MIMLEVKNIHKRFGGIEALKDVSFSIKKGLICALIGPNGAGKSTLLNIIGGIEKADRGEIFFKGKSIKNLSPVKRAKIGISKTFQQVELFKSMTVIENIIAGRYLRVNSGFLISAFIPPALRGQERQNYLISKEILDYIELSHRINEKASNLPAGEQRILEIGRALATDPELLLLDEPAAGLNIKETKSLSALIQRIRDEKGITILIVEHDMDLIMRISDYIVVLNFGEVIAQGNPLEIQKNPKVISAYLGEED